MRLVGTANQGRQDYLYDASGSVGTSAALLLPRAISRSYLLIQNTHATQTLAVEFGGARVVASGVTVTSAGLTGSVTAISLTGGNTGFGYKAPPIVRLLGGGYPQSINQGIFSSFNPVGQPDYPSPPNVATAVATISGGSVNGIVITNPGSGYGVAPYVQLINSDLDPYGAATPVIGTGGYQLGPLTAAATGTPSFIVFNGTFCPTDQVSIIGSGASTTFICKWAD